MDKILSYFPGGEEEEEPMKGSINEPVVSGEVKLEMPQDEVIKEKEKHPIKEVQAIAEEQITIRSFPEGDYVVHAYIEEARNLLADSADTNDPFVKVTCFKKSETTRTLSKIGTTDVAIWGEHLFIEANNLCRKDLEGQFIKATVYHDGILKNTEIGSYFFDIGSIYFNETHSVKHQWIALTSSTGEDREKIQGYLKLGLCVIGPGDQHVKLDTPVYEKTDSLILLPPTAFVEFYQLVIRFYDGQGLPDLDIGGGCDAYIHTDYMGQDARTKAIATKKGCVTWNEEMWLPMKKPALGGKVVFSVFDEDIGSDDYIGSMTFDLYDIGKEPKKTTRWVNLYGAVPDSGNSCYKRFYDQNPEIAPAWNGRILVQLEGLECRNPKQKCIPTLNSLESEVADAKKMRKYYINLHIGEGICLPAKKKDLSVEVKIAEYSFKPNNAPLNIGRCYSWNWKTPIDTVIELPYSSFEEFPDIFVYIKNGDKHYSFKRLQAKDYNKYTDKMEWLMLDENLADGGLEGKENCGIVSWNFSISTIPRSMTLEEKKQLQKYTRSRPTFYDVFVHIFQCKDLPAADEEGTSDTYISIFSMAEAPVKTSIAHGTLNPVLCSLLYNYRYGMLRSR